ncbi:MAG: universal stress protein [Calditrichaceae bacterium]|jgi:nucleotide-binding universal stress UspA family protein
MNYKNILLALEGEKDESKVIRQAAELSKKLSASLFVLHVNDPEAGKPSMMMDAPKAVHEDDLRKQIKEAGYPDIADKVDIHIVEGEHYPDKIAEATRDADMLVLGHSHKNRFLAALIDSVDERVTDIADCPVLIVPKS